MTGIQRYVIGFNRVPNKYGNCYQEVEFTLRDMNLKFLRKIFHVDMSSKDPLVLDMIYPLDINEEQAKLLNPYVIDGVIDTNLYKFELHCCPKPDDD